MRLKDGREILAQALLRRASVLDPMSIGCMADTCLSNVDGLIVASRVHERWDGGGLRRMRERRKNDSQGQLL